MKENISCQIIRDLLPNYIEGIVSIESKELVRAHLNECDCCKKEWENMNTIIDVDPVEERKIDYLKGIHKKCRTILLVCIILGVVTCLISVFYSEANYDEAIFTLAFWLIALLLIIITYGLPLAGAIVGILLFRKAKKKLEKLISFVIFVICSFWFFYSLVSVVNNIVRYGF